MQLLPSELSANHYICIYKYACITDTETTWQKSIHIAVGSAHISWIRLDWPVDGCTVRRCGGQCSASLCVAHPSLTRHLSCTSSNRGGERVRLEEWERRWWGGEGTERLAPISVGAIVHETPQTNIPTVREPYFLDWKLEHSLNWSRISSALIKSSSTAHKSEGVCFL